MNEFGVNNDFSGLFRLSLTIYWTFHEPASI